MNADQPGISIDIPEHILGKWQNITDLMANLIGVPAGLIMRIADEDIEVFVSSNTRGNPYHPGAKEQLRGSGLYSEHVINTKEKLRVSNALSDKKWKNNPDIKLNMVSYLGYPILWPNGKCFGTICVLDIKENPFSSIYEELVLKFLEILQTHLQLLYMNHMLGEEKRSLDSLLEETVRTRELFKKTFESQLDAILILDADKPARILNCNPAVSEMFGYQSEELIGKTPEILHVDRKYIESFRSQLFDAVERKQHFRFKNYKMKRKDGSVFHTVHSVMPLIDENSGTFGWVSVINDINDRVIAEKQLFTYKKNLEKIVKKRTSQLSAANLALQKEIADRENAESMLNKRKNELEEMNSALEVLLRKRESDKTELEEKVLSNMKNLILPYLTKLKIIIRDDQQKTYLRLIESNFQDILSPLSFKLSSQFRSLTPTEIKIADLIKNEKINKEIAKILNISIKTVEFHRDNIRKKLGIKNKKVNLRSYLLSIP